MNYLRTNIQAMAGYVPGFQPPQIASWIKLNTNENPYPPAPGVREAILAELGDDAASLRTYPSASSIALRETAPGCTVLILTGSSWPTVPMRC